MSKEIRLQSKLRSKRVEINKNDANHQDKKEKNCLKTSEDIIVKSTPEQKLNVGSKANPDMVLKEILKTCANCEKISQIKKKYGINVN